MRVKLGSLVSALSGSIAGTTFFSRNGNTFSQNKLRANKKFNPYFNKQKDTYAQVTSRWKTLSDSQRNSFLSAANPKLTAFNNYCRLNLNLLAIGAPTIASAQPFVPFPILTAFNHLFQPSSHTIFFTLDTTEDFPDFMYSFFFSQGVPLSYQSYNRNYYFIACTPVRYITSVNLWSSYTSRFPYLLDRQKLFVKIFLTHKLSGNKMFLNSTMLRV